MGKGKNNVEVNKVNTVETLEVVNNNEQTVQTVEVIQVENKNTLQVSTKEVEDLQKMLYDLLEKNKQLQAKVETRLTLAQAVALNNEKTDLSHKHAKFAANVQKITNGIKEVSNIVAFDDAIHFRLCLVRVNQNEDVQEFVFQLSNALVLKTALESVKAEVDRHMAIIAERITEIDNIVC